MNWWRLAKEQESLETRIKMRVRGSPFFVKLFEQKGVPLEKLDDLVISLKSLDDAHAKASDKRILVEDAYEDTILTSHFHIIAHEIVHWLKRQADEGNSAENSNPVDAEEIECWNIAVAYAMFEEESTAKFLDQVMDFIPDSDDANDFLNAREKDAKKLLSDMGLCNFS